MLASEFCRREVVERAVRAVRVVADAPGFDHRAHIGEGEEPMLVENIIAPIEMREVEGTVQAA